MEKQRHTIAWITATWFGTGLLPKAPGTWGSLAAIPFMYIFSAFAGPFVLIVAIIALFLIGIWASNKIEKSALKRDPGFIVVDEVVGQWIALLPLTFLSDLHSPYLFLTTIGTGFLTFRIFDIWKPCPIRQIEERTAGGLGIMLDDVVAGIYALIITTTLVGGLLLVV